MSGQFTIDDLERAVLVVRDPYSREARYVVERIDGDRLFASYMFRGRHRSPLKLSAGDLAEMGTGGAKGWIHAVGRVESHVNNGELTVAVDDVRSVQRRNAYREDVILPLKATDDLEVPPRRGRTQNISTGGFAGRIAGAPFGDGDEVLVSFDFPERDTVTVLSRKVGGDLPQRFQFVDIDGRTEERIARIVREAELERRRARRDEED